MNNVSAVNNNEIVMNKCGKEDGEIDPQVAFGTLNEYEAYDSSNNSTYALPTNFKSTEDEDDVEGYDIGMYEKEPAVYNNHLNKRDATNGFCTK